MRLAGLACITNTRVPRAGERGIKAARGRRAPSACPPGRAGALGQFGLAFDLCDGVAEIKRLRSIVGAPPRGQALGARRGLTLATRLAPQLSIFSAEINASCGISTFPN